MPGMRRAVALALCLAVAALLAASAASVSAHPGHHFRGPHYEEPTETVGLYNNPADEHRRVLQSLEGSLPDHLPRHSHTHAAHTFACGNSHPALKEMMDDSDAHVVPQKYAELHHDDIRAGVMAKHAELDDSDESEHAQNVRKMHRRLQISSSATYDNTYLTAFDADAAGAAVGIRLHVVWDPILGSAGADGAVTDGSDTSNHRSGTSSWSSGVMSCLSASESYVSVFDAAAPVGTPCTAEDVMTEDKADVYKVRADYMVEFFREALKVKPVQDDIVIHSALVDAFGLASNTVSNADLVVVMTARPAAGLNGYAICQQRDQNGRCTVGQLNLVPTVMDVASSNAPETIQGQRHTVLHELVHVLGGIGPNPVFINDDGTPRPQSEVWVSEEESAHYDKIVTKIITPKVLATARQHFGCDTLTGVAIEDQPTGKVAHWEARIFGAELMSYGTGTGETIFGDITFAYLEDTLQYVANYTMGGRLLEPTGDTGRDQEFKIRVFPCTEDCEEDEAAEGEEGEEGEAAAEEVVHGPGSLTWGRGKGCDFVEGSAGLWGEPYTCSEHQEYGCTPDYRMSAVCYLKAGLQYANQFFSCGDCPGSGSDSACSPTCSATINDAPSGSAYNLPTMFQYFTDRTGNEAFGTTSRVGAQIGGFSSAMDWAPVRLGYWNCQDAEASNGSSLIENQAGGGLSMSSLLGSSTDEMKLFGGQAYCADCRCFKSSLMDFSSGSINTNFPVYGLCYRTNCFREDYLQFAIESSIGRDTKWYKCNPAGGKLYIAGFAGALHCPEARDFCSFNEVTGIRYDETNPFWEWVFWSVVTGIPLLTMLICLIPPLRRHCVSRSKKWCGVNHFTRWGELDSDAEVDDDEEYHKPDKKDARILEVNTCIVFVLALIFFLVVAASAAMDRVSVASLMFIMMSLTTMGFSYLGWRAATKASRGTSCVAVVYMFILFFALLMYIFAALYSMLYPAALGKMIERQWPLIVDALPDGALNQDLVPDGGGEDLVRENGALFFFVFLVGFLMFGSQLWSVMHIVTKPVIMATMFTVISCVQVAFGVGFLGAAAYLSKFADLGDIGSNVGGLMALFVIIGLYLLGSGSWQIHASHTKKAKHMFISMILVCITTAFVCCVGFLMFGALRNVDDTLAAVSDDNISKAGEVMGFTNGSRDDISEMLKNNLRTMGLMGLIIMLMCAVLVMSTNYFLKRIQRHDEKKELAARKGALDAHRNKGRGGRGGRV